MTAKHRRLEAVVSGQVQGVGYRAFASRQARNLGLTGWTRNLLDGRVEVVAEGPEDSLLQLVGALRSGPYAASVERVTFDWQEPTGEFHAFGVRY